MHWSWTLSSAAEGVTGIRVVGEKAITLVAAIFRPESLQSRTASHMNSLPSCFKPLALDCAAPRDARTRPLLCCCQGTPQNSHPNTLHQPTSAMPPGIHPWRRQVAKFKISIEGLKSLSCYPHTGRAGWPFLTGFTTPP